jgi:hypothetical protein
MDPKVKYVCTAVKWFDKVNGNTYHSVSIVRTLDGERIVSCDMVYGYRDHYRHTALVLMLKAGWLPETYNEKNIYSFERENDYPILWNVRDGSKREMKENVRGGN